MTIEFDVACIQDADNERVGGWANKCAALLHVDAMGHPELLAMCMGRLREHPALVDALKKLCKRYGQEGAKVYKRYI